MVENFRQAQQQKSVDARTGKDVVHISADTVKLPRQPHNCVPSGVVFENFLDYGANVDHDARCLWTCCKKEWINPCRLRLLPIDGRKILNSSTIKLIRALLLQMTIWPEIEARLGKTLNWKRRLPIGLFHHRRSLCCSMVPTALPVYLPVGLFWLRPMMEMPFAAVLSVRHFVVQNYYRWKQSPLHIVKYCLHNVKKNCTIRWLPLCVCGTVFKNYVFRCAWLEMLNGDLS